MFIEFNANPKQKKTNDCSVRAVAVATGLGWDKSFEGLVASAYELKTVPSDTDAVEHFLIRQGFKVGRIRVVKGGHRPTVAEFAKLHPDWYCVLRVANHLTCSGKGNYVDIWDCGECAVYKYWYKPIIAK